MNSGDSNQDFEKTLPEGQQWFSPRWLAKYSGVTVQHIHNLIESGEIKDTVDLRGKGSRRSCINIRRSAVVDFLKRRQG